MGHLGSYTDFTLPLPMTGARLGSPSEANNKLNWHLTPGQIESKLGKRYYYSAIPSPLRMLLYSWSMFFCWQGCLELQLYWICHLQNLLKCEHNQQVMCEAGLPQQILDRCEAALITEEHPLHAPLQRMFERLASQSLTPTVLRYCHISCFLCWSLKLANRKCCRWLPWLMWINIKEIFFL